VRTVLKLLVDTFTAFEVQIATLDKALAAEGFGAGGVNSRIGAAGPAAENPPAASKTRCCVEMRRPNRQTPPDNPGEYGGSAGFGEGQATVNEFPERHQNRVKQALF
jgi:hypothetical protein